MIHSKPMTTCSPKRTGTGTCFWTRPGRSSRERLAALALPPQPPAPSWDLLCLPRFGLRARNGFRARTGGGGDCAATARWGVGLQARGGSWERPCPRARERRAPARGGGAAGGQVSLRRVIQATRLLLPPSPRRQGAEAVLLRLGLRPQLGGCLLVSVFPSLPFPAPWSPPYGVLWQRASWAAQGSVPEGPAAPVSRLPSSSSKAVGELALGGLAAVFGSAWRWTCWSAAGAEKTWGASAGFLAGLVGAGSGPRTVSLLNSVGR